METFLALTKLSPTDVWEVDLWVKIVTGSIAGVTAMIGIPLALQQYRKSSAEIRKLKLEADALEKQSTDPTSSSSAVAISKSPGAAVQITSDPRLRIPLLVLLDFIWAYIIMSLANHAVGLVEIGIISDLVRIVVALFLFVPVARKVRDAQRVFSPTDEHSNSDSESKNV